MNIDDLYPQPQIDHYFDIAGDQFHCSLEDEYSKNHIPYWSPWCNSGFGIDHHKCFKTPEACEKYMRKQVKITCKLYLRDLK